MLRPLLSTEQVHRDICGLSFLLSIVLAQDHFYSDFLCPLFTKETIFPIRDDERRAVTPSGNKSLSSARKAADAVNS